MALRLEQKQAIVAEVNEAASTALAAVLSDYRGLTVAEMTDLRAKARQSGVYLKVIRNTLARRAVAGTDYECLYEALTGPTMVAFSRDDPGSAARLIRDCAKDYQALEVKALAIGGELLGPDALDRWNDQAGYQGSVPDEVFFVDGGIMSNFPIGLFHVRDVPTRPTFGAKLGVERSEPAAIDSFFSLLGAVFDAARHTADYDFLLRNPDYRTLVGFIHTGSHNWLDFYLDDDAKIDLFARGVRAAATFLTSFDWASYKASRAGASGPAPA